MLIREVRERNQALVDGLLIVWEGSVRATHAFLSNAEVRRIKQYVPQAIGAVEHLVVAETYERTDHDEEGGPYPLLYMRSTSRSTRQS